VSALRSIGRFWFDFVVGDDWRIAAGIVLVVLAGALLVHGDVIGSGPLAIGVAVAVIALAGSSVLYDARRQR
jgi:hypothetical protein